MQEVGRSVDAKQTWLDLVKQSPAPQAMLRTFAEQYHYFSVHQIRAFSQLLRLLPASDRQGLSQVAQVIFEELGEGKPAQVHSVLFERFMHALGFRPGRPPLARTEVYPGVLAYVDALESAFLGPSLARALATYVFLEESATATYPALLGCLSAKGFSKEALVFFSLHAELEIHHAEAARALFDRLVVDSSQKQEADAQLARLDTLWRGFWEAILQGVLRTAP